MNEEPAAPPPPAATGNAAPAPPPGGPRKPDAPGPPAPAEPGVIPQDLQQPTTRTVLLVILAFLLLLGASFLIGWVPHHRLQEQTRADAARQGGDNPTVGVVHPREVAAEKELQLPCNVKPNQQADLYPQATGYLKTLFVDIQSSVKEGEVLAVIDTPQVDAQLDQSKAALEQARAAAVTAQSNLVLAQQTLERYSAAQKETSGSISALDLDQKQAAYDQAVAALAQARANVTAAQANVHQLTVTQNFEKVVAPFSGIITTRNFDVGAYLAAANNGPGKQLFSLVDSSKMRVFVSVPQIYATQISNGQAAFLEVSNYPGRRFAGIVALKADALDPVTRTMQFELDFPNPKNELLAGMYGQAWLKVSDPHPLLTIPSGALVFNADGVQVAAVRDGKIHYQKIAVGHDRGTELEILQGLQPDDLVVASPGERLREGLAVQSFVQDDPKAGPPQSQPQAAHAAAN